MRISSKIEHLAGLPDWPLLLQAEAAAAFTSLPVASFLRAVEHGELPVPIRLGGRILWSRTAIETHVAPAASRTGVEQDPIAAAIAAI